MLYRIPPNHIRRYFFEHVPSQTKTHLIQSTGLSRNVHFHETVSRYFYLHAQHWRSRLHRNVRQVGPELLGRNSVLRFGGMFHRIFISWLLHQVMNSDHSLLFFCWVGRESQHFPHKIRLILEGQIEIGKGGGTTWSASLTSQWWGEGKGEEKEVHHQAKGQTFRNTWAFCWIWEIWDLDGGWFPLSKTEKKTHHRWLSWKTWIPMVAFRESGEIVWVRLVAGFSRLFFLLVFFWIWWLSLKTTLFIMAGYRFFLSV